MHDICNLFGAALSRARRELGLTQIELAEKLGTTDRSISDLERGKTNPKLDRVGSSGCAMVTLPYGQNFESKNVTVPPWREAVTFCAWSADINCW